jgi:hypothetical protein
MYVFFFAIIVNLLTFLPGIFGIVLPGKYRWSFRFSGYLVPVDLPGSLNQWFSLGRQIVLPSLMGVARKKPEDMTLSIP